MCRVSCKSLLSDGTQDKICSWVSLSNIASELNQEKYCLKGLQLICLSLDLTSWECSLLHNRSSCPKTCTSAASVWFKPSSCDNTQEGFCFYRPTRVSQTSRTNNVRACRQQLIVEKAKRLQFLDKEQIALTNLRFQQTHNNQPDTIILVYSSQSKRKSKLEIKSKDTSVKVCCRCVMISDSVNVVLIVCGAGQADRWTQCLIELSHYDI